MTEATTAVGKPVVKQITELHEFPGNPKLHDIAAIRESIRRHGQYRPVVITSDNFILAGHGTKKALYDEGYDELDCFQLDITSDDENALRIVLGDNRIGELGGGYDDKSLSALLEKLAGSDDLLAATGYDMDAYEDLIARLDADVLPEQEFTGGHVPLPDLPIAPAVAELGEIQDVRQIMVTVTKDQHKELAENIKALKGLWKLEGSSAIILRAVAEAAKQA